MHVLVAAHDCYPDPGSGGTGRYVYETARRLVRRGHRVSVITRRRGSIPVRETIDDVDLYRYDVAIAEHSAAEILPQLPRAAGAVARHVDAATGAGAPDVVSYQGPVTAALVDRAVDAGVPRVATFHSPWPAEYRIKTLGTEGADGLRRRLNVALRRYVEGRVLAGADHVVTLSEYMREQLQSVYGEVADVTVIPGGVDAERFTPDGPVADEIDGDPAFLTVRRLSRRMGHETLLTAFAAVLEQHPDARLYVAGDGPLRDYLEDVAEAHGVASATTFLGYVPDEELPAIYRAADVFVLPTQALEGFGLATLEALASGLPVVATPVGGTVELLGDLETAAPIPAPMLVGAGDAGAVAAGMHAWADRPDRERRAAASACRRYARERYTWDRTVTRLQARYETLLSAGTGRVPPRRPPSASRPVDGSS